MGDTFLGIDTATWILAFFLLTAVIAVLLWFKQNGQRRKQLQALAASRQLAFLGTTPSDKHSPYTNIGTVKWAVLLYNVIEGQWNGVRIHAFDMPRGRHSLWTVVLAQVAGRLHSGPAAARVTASGPAAHIETDGLDVLFVSPKDVLEASELPAFLDFATALAKAMEQDAAASEQAHAPVAEPPMFKLVD